MAWGANFNFSVWFVELRGVQDPSVVDKVYSDYISVGLANAHYRMQLILL
jgi:hypothetical protein